MLGGGDHRDHQRRRQQPQDFPDDRVRRATQGDVAVRRDQRPRLGRQARVEAVGHVTREDQRRRPWPQPPGHPSTHLRDPGHPVGDLLGTFQEQGQRSV